jgi:hypothetical protein
MNKQKKGSDYVIPVSVRAEMALPRMSKSAKIAELKLDPARIREGPRTIMPGIVSKLIPSAPPNQREKAQIAIDGADREDRDFRIENSLTDEHGDEVKLNKGAHVEVTVKSEESEP